MGIVARRTSKRISEGKSKLNTVVYVLFGVQLMFSLISRRFYSFIAYIDNNQDSSGQGVMLILVLAVLAAVVCVWWFGRRHSLVLMFLSVEVISILYKVCLYPSQILRPSNLIYSVVAIALTVLFLVKMPPEEHLEQQSEPMHSSSTLGSGPKAADIAGMIMLYILAAIPAINDIYSQFADYNADYNHLLMLSSYLKLSYFFILFSVIDLLNTNTYLRDHLKAILVLILVFSLVKFVLPLMYLLPGINYIAYYTAYFLVYALLAILIIAPVYALLSGRRLPLLAWLSERISI